MPSNIPKWQPSRIKAVLKSTAHALPKLRPYVQGTGRVDVARAVNQPVSATPASLQFGMLRWPHENAKLLRKTLSYRNAGDAAVTLDLSIRARDKDGQPAPDGMFTLGTSQLTVPAGGSTEVTVTVDPSLGPVGLYEGRVSATSPGSDVAVETVLGMRKEPESYTLDARLIDRNGNTTRDVWNAYNYATGKTYTSRRGQELRVPTGRYAVLATVHTRGQEADSTTMLARLDVRLDGDSRLTLDARSAHRVKSTVDRPRAIPTFRQMVMVTKRPGSEAAHNIFGTISATTDTRFYAGSQGSAEKFGFASRSIFVKPKVQLQAQRPESFGVPVRYVPTRPSGGSPERLTGKHRLTVVDGGRHLRRPRWYRCWRQARGAGGAASAAVPACRAGEQRETGRWPRRPARR